MTGRFALALGAVMMLAAAPAAAQAGTESATFLLLPVGARAVATGGAVVAAAVGSEGIWWNPATVARDTVREVAIHHAQTVVATSDALVVSVPWRGIGVVALTATLIDLFEQEVTPPDGGPAIGTFLPRNVMASASLARSAGSRIDVGVTFKVLQSRLDCSGQCGSVPVDATTTTAVDAGARLSLAGWLPVTLGAAIRNVGPGLPSSDGGDRAPLPTRWQAGALYVVPAATRLADDLHLQLTGDVTSPVDDLALALRFGSEASWQQRVSLRGGYVLRHRSDRGDAASGPTVGLGLVAGRLVVDIAREFQGLSVDAGQPPTYVTLRFRF